jgi:hypothetical protein
MSGLQERIVMDSAMSSQNIVQLGTSRRIIATYSQYAEAQRAVDYLSDRKFPVEHVAIVAEGLKLVEQVTGRLTYGRVAVSGAMSGAFVGGLFGFIFGLFNWVTPMVSALQLSFYGLLYGALVGAAMSALFYSFTGGRRDFSSVGSIGAERYNVMVDESVADEASRLLTTLGQPRGGEALPRTDAPQPA